MRASSVLLGALVFLGVAVPSAHAAPLWAVDALPDLFSFSDVMGTCAESLSFAWLLEPSSSGAADRCGGLRGVAFAVLGLAAIVTIAIGRMRLATEHKRLDVARRLVEQGMDPPPGLLMGPARNDMRRGIVLMFAGVGVFVAGAIAGHRALMAGGLVPEFIGIGYLLSYWLAARTDADGGPL